MTQEVAAKSAPTGCWPCFGKKKEKPKTTPTPHHDIHLARKYTPKEEKDFAELVKADLTDAERDEFAKATEVFQNTKK